MGKRNRKSNKSNPQSKPLHRVNTLVDIVFAVHRRFDLFAECLESLPAAADGISYRVIAVDNNSPKEEADPFYAEHKDMKVIRNKVNYGFPLACNQGAKVGGSPLIFFLNTDVLLEPQSLVNLVRELDDPKVGIAGMKLMFPMESQDRGRPAGKVQHVGLAASIRGEFEHLFIGWSPDNPKVLALHEVPAVTGAALLVRRNLFVKAGGFFPGYGLGTYEDVDLAMAIHALGSKVVICQQAIGYHHVGATSRKYDIHYPMAMNRALFLSRWGGKFGWSAYDHY